MRKKNNEIRESKFWISTTVGNLGVLSQRKAKASIGFYYYIKRALFFNELDYGDSVVSNNCSTGDHVAF